MQQFLQERGPLILTVFVIINAIILLEFLYADFENKNMTADVETVEIAATSFGEFAIYFKELAEERGAVHAFSVLRETQFPPNIDLHLLGHVVGDELYKQEKMDGMQYCTHDFRNACSHTIVIGALLEKGPVALDLVHDACRKARGDVAVS